MNLPRWIDVVGRYTLVEEKAALPISRHEKSKRKKRFRASVRPKAQKLKRSLLDHTQWRKINK